MGTPAITHGCGGAAKGGAGGCGGSSAPVAARPLPTFPARVGDAAQGIVRALDANGDGRVSLRAADGRPSEAVHSSGVDLTAFVRVADRDGDGAATAEELASVLRRYDGALSKCPHMGADGVIDEQESQLFIRELTRQAAPPAPGGPGTGTGQAPPDAGNGTPGQPSSTTAGEPSTDTPGNGGEAAPPTGGDHHGHGGTAPAPPDTSGDLPAATTGGAATPAQPTPTEPAPAPAPPPDPGSYSVGDMGVTGGGGGDTAGILRIGGNDAATGLGLGGDPVTGGGGTPPGDNGVVVTGQPLPEVPPMDTGQGAPPQDTGGEQATGAEGAPPAGGEGQPGDAAQVGAGEPAEPAPAETPQDAPSGGGARGFG